MPETDEINAGLPDEDDPELSEEERKATSQANAAVRLGRSKAKAERERDAAARENAFLRAGLTDELLDSPVGKMFATAYTGEMTKEAVIAAATEVGLLTVEAPPTEGPVLTEAERKATEERRQLANGSESPDGEKPNPDPRDTVLADAQKRVDGGATREDVIGEGFRGLFDAGYRKNDARVFADLGTTDEA